MKRRVRRVLYRKWPEALLASILGLIPFAAAAALFVVLVWPKISSGQVVDFSALGLTGGSFDPVIVAGMLLGGGIVVNMDGLLSALIALAAPVAVLLFAGLPVKAGLSRYYLDLLRGKKPSPFSVYSCFGMAYPRWLGGMLLNTLWLCLWLALAVAFPVVLYVVGQQFTTPIANLLGLPNSWSVWAGLMVVCLVWFAAFMLVFLNRFLAFSFTPICLAAHPRLPGARAPRLSRKLARGCKWRLIALYASFLPWFLPAVIAAALLVLMQFSGEWLALSDVYSHYIRLFLMGLACANLLVLVYVGPYAAASRRAFYIERKREALMDEEVIPDDFGKKVREEKPVKKKDDGGAE